MEEYKNMNFRDKIKKIAFGIVQSLVFISRSYKISVCYFFSSLAQSSSINPFYEYIFLVRISAILN